LLVLIGRAGSDFLGVRGEAHVLAGQGVVLVDDVPEILDLSADIADLLRHYVTAFAHLRQYLSECDGIDVDDHPGNPPHEQAEQQMGAAAENHEQNRSQNTRR